MNYKKALISNITQTKIDELNIEQKEYDNLDYILFLKNNGETSIQTIVDLNLHGSYMYYYDFLKKRYHINIADNFILNDIRTLKCEDKFLEIYNLYKSNKFVVIPLCIIYHYKITQNEYGHGHANVLVLHNNLLEHYDPHGKYNVNKIIYNLNFLHKKLKKYIPKLILKTSTQIHKNKEGFQTIETKSSIVVNDGGGSCVAWCSLFCELLLNNKKLSSDEVINIISDIFRTNKIDLKYIITGYRNIHAKNLEDFNFNNSCYYHLRYYDEYIKKFF